MSRLCRIAAAVPGFLISVVAANAQDAKVDQIKAQIADAQAIQRSFTEGLKFCSSLDGKSFYFDRQKRVVKLDDYLQSLQNLVKDNAYNPDKKRPWTQADADERRTLVQKTAEHDKVSCEKVARLPALQKQLADLAGPPKK